MAKLTGTPWRWVIALGPVRILLVVPQVGERIAELFEAPVMLVVIFFSARFVVCRFKVPVSVGDRLVIGLLAFSLGLLFEFTLVMKLRSLTLSQYFRNERFNRRHGLLLNARVVRSHAFAC